MNRIKWILRSITLCCTLVPLLLVGLTYRDNVLGLIIPPQLQNLIQNGSNSNSNKVNTLNSALAQLGIDPSGIQTPHIENFTYDNQTGLAGLTLNFTNPMTKQSLDVSSFSIDVSDSNGNNLFAIQLNQPVSIGAGQSASISLSASSLTPEAQALMQSIVNANKTIDTSNLQFSDLSANVGGVIIHVNNLNNLGGLFGGYNDNSNGSLNGVDNDNNNGITNGIN